MTSEPSADELRRLALKRPDAWWTVLVVDPVVMRVLPHVVHRRSWTPDRVTLVGSACGVGAIVCFATGQLLLGALLFELRFFLDCLDGKLARVRGTTSARGALLDMTSDVVLITGSIAALAWHLAPGGGGGDGDTVPLALSAATALAAFWLFWLVLWDLDHPSPRGRAPTRGSERWLAQRRMHRRPRTVEAETLLLFVAPLTGSEPVLRVAFALALAYFLLAAAALFLRLWRSSDDRTGPPPEGLPLP